MELERTVEPTWPKLVEPLERIVDRLQVVWGIVNHLKSVKDSPELRSAIEEIQARIYSLLGRFCFVYRLDIIELLIHLFLITVLLCFVPPLSFGIGKVIR